MAAQTPSVFERGPGFEGLTAAADRGDALARPLLQVIRDAAGVGILPISVSTSWDVVRECARVSVGLMNPRDVEVLGEFYDLRPDNAWRVVRRSGVVGVEHTGNPDLPPFELRVITADPGAGR